MKKILTVLMSVLLVVLMIQSPMANASQQKNPEFLTGKLSGKLTKDFKGAIKFFNNNKELFKIQNAENELAELSTSDDELGYSHVKVQQMVKGIPVYGREYIVHFNRDGEVYAVNGGFDPSAKEVKFNKGNFLGENKAIEIGKAQVQFDELEMEPNAKLYLYQVNNKYVPVYEVRINFLSPMPGDWHYFIDAATGEIVNKYNAINEAAVTGTGIGVLGDSKSINLDKVTVTSKGTTTVQYQMVDTTKAMASSGGYIMTYNANNGTRLPGSLVYDTDATFDASTQRAAVDAHYYVGKVYDYYYTIFGRNSINNRGMTIKSTVHYSRNYVNAFWNGQQMVFGDGDGVQSLALSGSFDVIAHELTHGVNSYTANLTYQNQSGALSESISDTMGTFAEYHMQNAKFDWLIGEDVWTPNKQGDALRSMSNPAAYGDPDHMSKYVNTTSDNGGVHTNSGIPNKAAYLIATNSSVGVEKAEQIYYRALTVYFTSSTNFHGARVALAQAAMDLYGSTAQNAVYSAFDSVGVY